MAAQPHKSCRPRSTSPLGRAPTFHTAFLRPASEPGPAGRRAAHLRSEAGRARLRRDDPTQRNDRLLPPRSQQCQRCPLTCGFGARGGIRTDDLPITRRMLGVDLDGSRRIEPAHVGCLVGPDGSRRIQKDRLDDQTDDQGLSDRIGCQGMRRFPGSWMIKASGPSGKTIGGRGRRETPGRRPMPSRGATFHLPGEITPIG